MRILAVAALGLALIGSPAWAKGKAADPRRPVAVDLPIGALTFTGDGAEKVNLNCLTCHSAEMVLTQPKMPRATWAAEVEKMRAAYHAPVAAEDVKDIVDYLAALPAPR